MVYILTLWTNDPTRAAWADRSGVDRIGLDLESLGKKERQQGWPTWISGHTIDDLDRLKPKIQHSTLFVRVNPLHERSAAEIEILVRGGVKVVMQPNFTCAEEVEALVRITAGRALVVPLVERLAAIDVIPVLPSLGIEEIHVGLNDLSIELGLRNRLALLASPIMDRLANAAHCAGLRLGLGGLARAMDADLPVPSDLVYAQHARLGASGALIARSFFARTMQEATFATEIGRLRQRLAEWSSATPAELEAARAALMQFAEG